jgi:hypothetical protein
MRLATFNVENLFDRAAAMNLPTFVGIVVNLVLGLTCLPVFYQLDDGISAGETARTANPVQTTGLFEVKRGFTVNCMYAEKSCISGLVS